MSFRQHRLIFNCQSYRCVTKQLWHCHDIPSGCAFGNILMTFWEIYCHIPIFPVHNCIILLHGKIKHPILITHSGRYWKVSYCTRCRISRAIQRCNHYITVFVKMKFFKIWGNIILFCWFVFFLFSPES